MDQIAQLDKLDVVEMVHSFCRDNGLFDGGVNIGEDKHELTHVICENSKQADAVEEFLKSIEDELTEMMRMDDIIIVVYSDEYSQCSSCGSVVRTSADCYGWTPDFWIGDGFLECSVCMHDNPEGYLEHITNNPLTANVLFTRDELIEKGFAKLDDSYQNGLHTGMNDNPQKLYNKFKDQFAQIIFNIAETSQFYITFDIYVKNEEEED